MIGVSLLCNYFKDYNDKSILILGFGREGKSTYKFLREYFPDKKIFIADNNVSIELQINDSNIGFILGEKYLDSIENYDLIIKSPGISLKNIDAKKLADLNIQSQTSIFIQLFKSQIIGITGTKGKSTVSSLLFHVLSSKYECFLGGNIGLPVFELSDKITDKAIVILELSSHQLEFLTQAPHTSAILNLFEEHLDHYKDFRLYQMAKINIVKYQEKGDVFYYDGENKLIGERLKEIEKHSTLIDYSKAESIISEDDSKRELKGNHNYKNANLVYQICKKFNIDDDVFIGKLNSFKSLAHRMEFIAEKGGVKYINDSIATIPQASIEAIKCFKNISSIILGGYDRGIDYRGLADFLISSNIKNIVLMGDAGKRIYLLLKGIDKSRISIFESMTEAFKYASSNAVKGSICLLSPAASSYNEFKNFEERGNLFKQMVNNIV